MKLLIGSKVHKLDKATGIKASYQIKENNLITDIEVPERTEKIAVSDTTTTITTIEEKVYEERGSFFD